MPATEISAEKRRLIEESETYRRAIGAEVQHIKASTAWVPRTVGILRVVSPLLALSAPVIGLLFRRKKKAEPKLEHNGKSQKGLVAKALVLFEVFRKAKPFLDTFYRSRQRRTDRSKEASSRSASGK